MGSYPKITPIIATGGSTPRYLGDRFGDIVNLKDFGAAGDGETDDSTAWAAWQTALQSGGMPYIPKGDYLLGEEIVHAPKGHFGRNVAAFSYVDDGAVLDEFSAPVYVDPDGDDANDGMSSTNAVQTLAKAIEISAGLPQERHRIVVAAGTYNGNATFEYFIGDVEILGNVTINGIVGVYSGSYVNFFAHNSGGHTLSINSSSSYALDVSHAIAHFVCAVSVSLQSGSVENLIRTINSAACSFASSLSCSISSGAAVTSGCILTSSMSYFLVNGNITLNGDMGGCVRCVLGSVCKFYSTTFYFHNTGTVFSVYEGGAVACYSVSFDVVCSKFASVSSSSFLNVPSMEGTVSTSSRFVELYDLSVVSMSIQSGKTLNLTCNNNSAVVTVNSGASFGLNGSGTVKLTGSASSAVVLCASRGYVDIGTDILFTGSSMTGKRYSVYVQGYVAVHGAGVNRIPGSVAGSVDTTNFGFYG